MPVPSIEQVQSQYPQGSVGHFLEQDYNNRRYAEVTEALRGGLLLPPVLHQNLPNDLQSDLRAALNYAAISYSARISHVDVLSQASQLNACLPAKERASLHIESLRNLFARGCDVIIPGEDSDSKPFQYLQELIPPRNVSTQYRQAIDILRDELRIPEDIGVLNSTQVLYLRQTIQYAIGCTNGGLDGIKTDDLIIIARYLRSLAGA